MVRIAAFAISLALLASVGLAVDNGIGLTPPMGWRHWKAFAAHISQDIMEEMMDEMVKKYPVDGVPTSLKDLGYLYVGLDDHWQNCTTVCANGTVVPSWKPQCSEPDRCDYDYQCCRGADGQCEKDAKSLPWFSDGTDGHAYGTPLFDKVRFPDVKGMVQKAHTLGLRAGWYAGNYQCAGANSRGKDQPPWDMDKLVAGSVDAIKSYGFDSVKCDSGFAVCRNMSLWAQLLNESGRPVMIENCHQGGEGPGLVQDGAYTHNCTGLTPVSDCPFNFWRTTGDPEPGWGTIQRELNSLRKVVNPYYGNGKRPHSVEYNADPPRSRPGGYAYPGTMVVGDGGSVVNGTIHGGMTKDENRVHFGGWCIVSSPMILAYNLSTPERRELVWDIITNKEAIQVNQAWAGHPGSQKLVNIGSNSQVEVWTKPLGDQRTAAFILNTAVNNKSTATTEAGAAALSTDTDTSVGAGDGDGGMSMTKCDSSRPSQVWSLSPGVTPGSTPPKLTNVQAVLVGGKGGCIEITGCSTKPNAHVGTHYGCKGLPKAPCAGNLCACNGAWNLNSNGTVTSVMDGQCLQTSGTSISVGTCVPNSATQQFKWVEAQSDVEAIGGTKTTKGYRMQQGDLCVDNNQSPPPTPAPPPPGGPARVSFDLLDPRLGLGLDPSVGVRVRDVWNKRDLPPVKPHTAAAASLNFTLPFEVPYHGSAFLVFMPATDTKWPLPFELAPWMRSPAPPVPPN